MAVRKKKRVIFNFLPYEYRSLEEYLEKMAVKGWILEDINGHILKFKKSEPKKLRYSVDIMDSISFLDGKDNEEALEYREYCKKAGWEFICGSDKKQIYCSEEQRNRIDIHTDEVEKFNTIAKASFKYVCLNLITLISVFITQYIGTIGDNDANFLASLVSLSGLILSSIFLIHEILGIATFLAFIINGKISLNKGRKIKYNYKKVVLVRRSLYFIFFMLLPILVLSFAIEYDINMLKIFIVMIVLIFLYSYIINFIKNKNYENGKIIIIITHFIMTILTLIIITSVMSYTILEDLKNKENKYGKRLEKASYLKLEDFNDTSSTKDSIKYYRTTKSPIASNLYYSDDGEKINLNYEIFQSNYKWPVKYNFEKKMKFVNENNIRYIEKETNLPKDIKVYMNELGHEYIIISENKMVEISTVEEISEEELINTVYEKVFKEV